MPWHAGLGELLADLGFGNGPWELYDLSKDFSQANDLAAEEPEKLAAMKALFLEEAEDNKVFPIGAGLWLRLHPEDRVKPPYTSWTFGPTAAGCRSSPRPASGGRARP